jgi:hypothetical protein
MSTPYHHFCELFEQLGLAADPESIAAFIEGHSPLPADVRLEDASFWSPSQGAMLRQHLLNDSNWAGLVDQLNLALRADRH